MGQAWELTQVTSAHRPLVTVVSAKEAGKYG